MITLSDDRTHANVYGQELKVGQTVEYKPAGELRTAMGKIESFKYAKIAEQVGMTVAGPQLAWRDDKSSVWMQVADIENLKRKETVSLEMWHTLFTPKPTENDNTESEDVEKYPF